LKAIGKLSIGCIGLALTLQGSAFGTTSSVVPVIAAANSVLSQSDTSSDAARRRDADKSLRQAREALEARKFELAEYHVAQAERFKANYDSVRSRFVDTPEKVRREIAAAKAKVTPGTRPPSQRFDPTASLPGGKPATNQRSPRSAASNNRVLATLTDDSKAKARDYLVRGRAALQQGDTPGAMAWYQKAVNAGASFAPSEYSPIQLAAELRRAGVDVSQLVQRPSESPFPTKPADFAVGGLDRLPPLQMKPPRANTAFDGNAITNPAQLGSNQNTGQPASPSKTAALGLVAEAQAALRRGDLPRARHFAERAQAMRVPDGEFRQNETRPWEVLLRIQSAVNRRGGSGVSPAGYQEAMPAIADGSRQNPSATRQGLYVPEQDGTRNRLAQGESPTPANRPPISETPVPESRGQQLYREGIRALEGQDRAAALRAFRQAWRFEQDLDLATRRDLQTKLSSLGTPAPRTLREPSPLDEVSSQQDLLRQKLFREIATESKIAEKMIPGDPRGANRRMQSLRERVSQADVNPAARKQLLTMVDREIAAVESYIQQHLGDIELNERNQQVTDEINQDRQEKNEIQQKVAELVEQFNDFLEEERYSEAEFVAKQIRELEPDSPVTRLVTIKSKFIKNIELDRAIREEKEDGFISTLRDADRAMRIPVGDENPIDFGGIDNWDKLSKSRLERLHMEQRRLSPSELEIQNSLKTPVDVHFTDKPLKEVLDTFSDLAGINIYPDPQGLATEGITSDTPVTINLTKPISLRSALDLILQPLRLGYVIQNEVLRITSEQSKDSNVYPKVYNVADLVIPIPNFVPGHTMDLPSAIREAHRSLGYGGAVQPVSMGPLTLSANDAQNGAATDSSVLSQTGAYGLMSKSSKSRPLQGSGSGAGGMGGAALADFDTLIELIESTIAPETWDEVGGPGAIEEFPTNLSLVISQTQDVHEQVADLLEQLRRLQDLQVAIEVRFITLQDDFFERIGVDFDFDIDDNVTTLPPDDQGPSVSIGLDLDGTPTADFDYSFTQDSFSSAVPAFGGFTATNAANFGFAILSDIEAFFLIQAAQGSDRSNVLQAPKVTLFNGQLASVSDVSLRPFVTSLIPVVGDFAAAHQPVIVVLSEGTSLSVQAVVSSDRRFVRLTLVPFFSQIGEVETFTFTGSTTTNTGSNVIDPNGEPSGDVDNATTTTAGTTVQLPTFAFTSVSTTVSVPDGGTVLLGGIKRLREARNENGVPMLNKLPYVNRLFKNVGIGRDTQSLMLMVTPRIIIQEEEEERLGIDITP
jgi:general secretion pathway protein D